MLQRTFNIIYFRIVKAALDALITGICTHRKVTKEVALQMAKSHLESMTEQWWSGKAPNIKYGDPLCRFAYLFCHTPVNAGICDYFISLHPETLRYLIDTLNTNETLRVCAFGGGPGTELLALVKLLQRAHNKGEISAQGDIRFTLLDNTPEWAESWAALESAIKDKFSTQYGKRQTWPFLMSSCFQPYDITKVDQFANLIQLLIHDVYILNYVVSEITTEHEALSKTIDTMTSYAPSGARFVFIDRNQDDILERAKQLLKSAGLKKTWLRNSSSYMEIEEQTSVLKDYIAGIGRSPRAQWNGAFCLVGVKP